MWALCWGACRHPPSCRHSRAGVGAGPALQPDGAGLLTCSCHLGSWARRLHSGLRVLEFVGGDGTASFSPPTVRMSVDPACVEGPWRAWKVGRLHCSSGDWSGGRGRGFALGLLIQQTFLCLSFPIHNGMGLLLYKVVFRISGSKVPRKDGVRVVRLRWRVGFGACVPPGLRAKSLRAKVLGFCGPVCSWWATHSWVAFAPALARLLWA